MNPHTITVRNGSLQFIYADELVPLLALGTAAVERVKWEVPAGLAAPRGRLMMKAELEARGLA